jgi:hypothetical protein
MVRAQLTKVEEMCDQLVDDQRLELGSRLDRLLAHPQKATTLDRLRKCHDLIASAHASLERTERNEFSHTLRGPVELHFVQSSPAAETFILAILITPVTRSSVPRFPA